MRQIVVLFAGLTLLASGTKAQEAAGEWRDYLDHLGAPERLGRIAGIHADAGVTVSDGTTYETSALFKHRQKMLLQFRYPDRSGTYGIDGKYFWGFEGETQQDAGDFVGGFVAGHQFHALLLKFAELHRDFAGPERLEFEDRAGIAIRGASELATRSLVLEADSLLPLGILIHRDDGPDIAIAFLDWRLDDGVRLPHEITIDDGESLFTYRFTRLTLEAPDFEPFIPPISALSDTQQLRRLHRVVMEAHFDESGDSLPAVFGEEFVVASAGEVSSSDGQTSAAQLASSFERRRHSVYDDMILPVVRVSDDGTLGWVVVQVHAEGHRLGPDGSVTGPLNFTSAWVELYRKQDGQWQMVGNVSNFAPVEEN